MIQLGSIINGTLRKEDLIPTFIYELLQLDSDNSLGLELQNKIDNGDYDFDSEDAGYDIEAIMDEFENLMNIPYVYFGTLDDDPTDFGWWVDVPEPNDFDGMIVEDLSEVPDNYDGLVMHVNDHGNTTLWESEEGNMTELWSVV
jgi:hypothetical protein